MAGAAADGVCGADAAAAQVRPDQGARSRLPRWSLWVECPPGIDGLVPAPSTPHSYKVIIGGCATKIRLG